MMPVIGDSMRTLLRFSLAFSTVACSCVMRRRWVSICRSCAVTSAWRIRTRFSALSRFSFGVSPPCSSCCWRVSCSSRLLQRGPGALDLDAQLFHLRARRRERRRRLVEGRREVARVDLKEELPLLHLLAFLDPQVRDPAHRIGADVDEALRLDLARGRHDGLQIPLLDRFDVDDDAVLPLELDVGVGDRAQNDGQSDPDENLLVPTHAPPARLLTSAITMAITA